LNNVIEVVGIVTINLKKIYQRRKIMNERQVKWAILFTPFEHEDTEYVKEGCGAKWNTGEIVRWIVNERHNFEGEER
jgi:hypothetical protein